MQRESSLPHSQVPATCPFPELANSLDAAVSEPALYRLLTFQVPSNMSLFRLRLRDTSSRNTPPPGDTCIRTVSEIHQYCSHTLRLSSEVLRSNSVRGKPQYDRMSVCLPIQHCDRRI